MALADEEPKAAAWRSRRRTRYAAEKARLRALAGSKELEAQLEEDWAPLIPGRNVVERQKSSDA